MREMLLLRNARWFGKLGECGDGGASGLSRSTQGSRERVERCKHTIRRDGLTWDKGRWDSTRPRCIWAIWLNRMILSLIH